MAELLNGRRNQSNERLEALKRQLARAEALAGTNACVYVTGSFGRAEASVHSDLDLFIVGRAAVNPKNDGDRGFSNLDEICLKAELISAVREHNFPEFSGDGAYLVHYTVRELVKSLGTATDDAQNTFTARLLLLLESQPLLGAALYSEVIDDVIAAYWRDFPGHEANFAPAFLANDILRLWRTFCVNYESRTTTESDIKKNKRRLKNYKLKHSRLLTCYSALLHLMAVWSARATVTNGDAKAIFSKSPTQRIEAIIGMNISVAVNDTLTRLLGTYEQFLQQSDADEGTLLTQIGQDDQRRAMLNSAATFGQLVFDAIEQIGNRSAFHRMLVV
jgi:hypothetical protein